MPYVSPLIKAGLAITGLPKEKQVTRYVAMHTNESKKSKDVAAQVFYKISQFFLTFVGQSDKQIIKKATTAYICKIAKDFTETMGQKPTSKDIRQLKKTVKPMLKPMLKGLVALNKMPLALPKETTDAIIKNAKVARDAITKGNFKPAIRILEQLAGETPNRLAQFNFQRLIGLFTQLDDMQHRPRLV